MPTRGVVYVHSTPLAVCPHVEWAIARVLGSPVRLALLEYLNDRFGFLDDLATGTKVSIGVASGADRVYVTKDPTVAEADRMLGQPNL